MKLESVDPYTLLTPLRMDYVIKVRFFRHLLNGGDPDSERVYRWHIEKRTGGNEPRSPKNCVDDYVRACPVLLESIRINGFQPRGAVKIAPDNRIMGSGAHRMSICLLLKKPILIYRVNKFPKKEWGRDWFVFAGMSKADLADLDAGWKDLQAAA
jgi:hypothetical protein